MMVLGVYARSAALFGLACGASLQQVADFGQNPTKINMHIYVPDKLANSPAVVVAVSAPPVKATAAPGSADPYV